MLVNGNAAPPSFSGAATDPRFEAVRKLLKLPADPSQRETVEAALKLVLTTAVGARRADEFIAESRPVEIAFEIFPGCKVETGWGRRFLDCSSGHTNAEGTALRVALAETFLRTDLAFRRQFLAGVLAHELFGHSLRTIQAERAGVGRAYYHFDGNEADAEATGLSVDAELSDLRLSRDADRYRLFVSSPAAYRDGLQLNMPYYALTFSREELREPVAVLRRRLELCRAQRVANSKLLQRWRKRERHVAHLLAAHRGETLAGVVVGTAALAEIQGSIARGVQGAERRRGMLDDIELAVIQHIDYDSLPAGQKRIAEMNASLDTDAGKAFLAAHERDLKSQREFLASKLGHKPAFQVSGHANPGQVTWAQLQKMLQAEKELGPDTMTRK